MTRTDPAAPPATAWPTADPTLVVNLLSPTLDPSLLEVTAGVRPLEGSPGALVARTPWRELDEAERLATFRDPPAPLATSVSFVDLGPDVLEEAHRSLVPLLAPAKGTTGAIDRTDALRRFQALVLSRLADRHGVVPESVGAADLVVNRPGLESTAFNAKTGCFMGLHVDSHQRLPFGERDAAMTLCSVNVGFAERHLCFAPLRVVEMVDVVVDAGEPVPDSAQGLKDRFLALRPDVPILRATLAPGQAYLCTTQNVLHDGATNDAGQPDVSFLTMSSLRDGAPRVGGPR